jgi:hypothetical protein
VGALVRGVSRCTLVGRRWWSALEGRVSGGTLVQRVGRTR